MVAVGGSGKQLDIHLKRFRPAEMQTNRVCIMVGKKGTGKSTLVEDIMWFQQHIPVGAIMSATEESNEAYSRMAPPLFIYKNFDADALLRLINRQKKMKSLYKQNGNYLPFDHRAFVLMDDCMYDKKNFRGSLMRELFMNGRHWDLFVLITMQYVMDITPEIRTNTDYVFALKENVRKNRERLYNEFFGVFPSFAVFDALFLEVTQNWRCLVLDTTVASTEIEDCVFWYKAEKRPPFRLGSEWFWEYSRQNGLGKNETNRERNALELEEMRQKAVRVVFEGERKPPSTEKKHQPPENNPLRIPPLRGPPPRGQGLTSQIGQMGQSNISFRAPGAPKGAYVSSTSGNQEPYYPREMDYSNRDMQNQYVYQVPDTYNSRPIPPRNPPMARPYDSQPEQSVMAPVRAAYSANTTTSTSIGSSPYQMTQLPPTAPYYQPQPQQQQFGGFIY